MVWKSEKIAWSEVIWHQMSQKGLNKVKKWNWSRSHFGRTERFMAASEYIAVALCGGPFTPISLIKSEVSLPRCLTQFFSFLSQIAGNHSRSHQMTNARWMHQKEGKSLRESPTIWARALTEYQLRNQDALSTTVQGNTWLTFPGSLQKLSLSGSRRLWMVSFCKREHNFQGYHIYFCNCLCLSYVTPFLDILRIWWNHFASQWAK